MCQEQDSSNKTKELNRTNATCMATHRRRASGNSYLVGKVKAWMIGVSPGQLESETAKKVSSRRIVLNHLADFGLGVLATIVALGERICIYKQI